MRIVSGKYRRRLLLTNAGQITRPITDRAKVILFDRLQGLLEEGPRVADIFCGTGTMGLEALSRGASTCVFFEADKVAHELLIKNVEALGAQQESMCWKTDVFRTTFHPKRCPNFLPYDLIFFDPPYHMTHKIRPGALLYAALERLGKVELCSENALMILRCDDRAEFELPPVWQPDVTHRVNNMMLHFFRFSSTGASPSTTPNGDSATSASGLDVSVWDDSGEEVEPSE